MRHEAILSFDNGDIVVRGEDVADLIKNCCYACLDTELEDFTLPDGVT